MKKLYRKLRDVDTQEICYIVTISRFYCYEDLVLMSLDLVQELGLKRSDLSGNSGMDLVDHLIENGIVFCEDKAELRMILLYAFRCLAEDDVIWRKDSGRKYWAILDMLYPGHWNVDANHFATYEEAAQWLTETAKKTVQNARRAFGLEDKASAKDLTDKQVQAWNTMTRESEMRIVLIDFDTGEHEVYWLSGLAEMGLVPVHPELP